MIVPFLSLELKSQAILLLIQKYRSSTRTEDNERRCRRRELTLTGEMKTLPLKGSSTLNCVPPR